MKNSKFRLFVWYLIAAGVVALDQLTKMLAVRELSRKDSIPIIKDVLHLTYVTNEGAAFSMLSNQRWIFMLISAVTIVVLLYLVFAFRQCNGLFCASLAMILGGGIGNMIDRTVLGYVVDFVDFRAIDFAVFNVADSFVCIGCVLLFIYLIFLDSKQPEHRVFSKTDDKSAKQEVPEKMVSTKATDHTDGSDDV